MALAVKFIRSTPWFNLPKNKESAPLFRGCMLHCSMFFVNVGRANNNNNSLHALRRYKYNSFNLLHSFCSAHNFVRNNNNNTLYQLHALHALIPISVLSQISIPGVSSLLFCRAKRLVKIAFMLFFV